MPIVRRERGEKALRLVYARGGTNTVVEQRVPVTERRAFVLDDDEVLELARWAVRIERHYSESADRVLRRRPRRQGLRRPG